MSGFPGISRVTDSMVSNRIMNSLQRSLQGMARSEQAIASGRRFNSLGDDPLAARRSVSWERLIERHEQYSTNIQAASSRLAASEGALVELENMIVRAQEIALEQVQSTATDQTRENSAIEMGNIVQEALTLANRQFGDRFLFGGDSVAQAPFGQAGEFVSYSGDQQESLIEIAPGMHFASGISGVRAFGGWSSQVAGGVDLDPNLNLETPIATLNGGRGIASGRIEIRDGMGGSEVVDLSTAKTIGDALDLLNESGFLNASLDPTKNGILLSKGGANLSVSDMNGSTAARDLGIAQTGAGPNLGGEDLDPLIRPLTRMSLLRNGLGVDPDGFTIQNGGQSVSLDLTGVDTVQGLLNAVNTSGIGVQARVSANGTGIELFSQLAGADLRVVEGTGQTASQLGLILPSESLPLDTLHAGAGVPTVTGIDFRIVAADGTSFEVDVSGAETLADVVSRINENSANTGVVFAEVVPGEERLRLRDLTGAPGTMVVEPQNGSFAASGLRIEGEAVAGIIEGEPLDPGGVRLRSAFDGFGTLERGLATSDTNQIRSAIRYLDAAQQRVLQAQAEIGSRLRRLEISERRNDIEILETETLLSDEGDTDLAATIVDFNRQQTQYQASLQTSAQLVQLSILDFLG